MQLDKLVVEVFNKLGNLLNMEVPRWVLLLGAALAAYGAFVQIKMWRELGKHYYSNCKLCQNAHDKQDHEQFADWREDA